MTGKSQAKTQCKTLKGYTRGISEKRGTRSAEVIGVTFLTPAPVPKKVTPAPAPALIGSLHSDSCLHSETPTPVCTLESRIYFVI